MANYLNNALERPDNFVNNAGSTGSFKITPMQQLDRFLILGSENGTYYVSEQKLTQDNAKNLISLLSGPSSKAVVDRIVEISKSGRAAKNDFAIFALACALSFGNSKQYAATKVTDVCRTATHLFQLVEYIDSNKMRGWGRTLRTAVAGWYENKSAKDLAYQMVKYRERNGYSHHDLMHFSHPTFTTPDKNFLAAWAKEGSEIILSPKWMEFLFSNEFLYSKDFQNIRGYEILKNDPALTTKTVLYWIKQGNLSREMIPNQFLNSPEIWEALLPDMPITAMIRNLGNMSKAGILGTLSKNSKYVVSQLSNIQKLKNGRVHPFNVLFAMRTYASGHGFRGNNSWEVNQKIVEALEDAFYACFQNVVPTGKNTLIGLDVSGSMSQTILNSNISCAEAGSALALLTAKTEPWTATYGFSTTFRDLQITAKDNLESATRKANDWNFGGTDCSLPMIYATERKIPVDTFVVITDCETWAHRIKPSQALENYRQSMGRDAKLIVVGMTATNVSIADPKDSGMLDVVGFDSGAPTIMNEFVRM